MSAGSISLGSPGNIRTFAVAIGYFVVGVAVGCLLSGSSIVRNVASVFEHAPPPANGFAFQTANRC